MRATPTSIPDVRMIEPKVFGDNRGFSFESFNRHAFKEAIGIDISFVQDNHSKSAKNVLRGLHYQISQPQGKLIHVIAGEVFDVVVDLRKSSPTFRRWVSITLSAENKRMVWVPPGFAHGFFVISDIAEVLYKATDYWAPEFERSILWNDPALDIDWKLSGEPILSAKDRAGQWLEDAEVYD